MLKKKHLILFSLVSAEVYDAQMSPMEAVVLNAMMTGSSLLNLRAHFLHHLPDLSGLAGMLTHLNLSFNDLWVSIISQSILSLPRLTSGHSLGFDPHRLKS